MAPGRAAKDPILKLETDQIVAIKVQKISDSLI
jgi:hypothetical protein